MQACIDIENICDGTDDCGDESDENFYDGICSEYQLSDFEEEENPLGLFAIYDGPEYPLIWTNAQPDMAALGKMPMFDHSDFNILFHYLHVGGLNPNVSDGSTGRVKGRIISAPLIRMQEDEDFFCQVVFYYYNLGIDDSIGVVRLFVVHK